MVKPRCISIFYWHFVLLCIVSFLSILKFFNQAVNASEIFSSKQRISSSSPKSDQEYQIPPSSARSGLRLKLADSNSPFGDLFGHIFSGPDTSRRSPKAVTRQRTIDRPARRSPISVERTNRRLGGREAQQPQRASEPRRSRFTHRVLSSEQPVGYSTVCVRLCDGYYWPMSFSTSRQFFKRDAERCQSSCAAETRLFIIKTPTVVSEDAPVPDMAAGMADLDGKKYSETEHAFLYRTAITPQCLCRTDQYLEQTAAEQRLAAARAHFFAILAARKAQREARFLRRLREVRHARFLAKARQHVMAKEAQALRIALRRYREKLLPRASPTNLPVWPVTAEVTQPHPVVWAIAPLVIPRRPRREEFGEDLPN